MLLVERGLAEAPEMARALVMAGAVAVGGRPVLKAGTLVDEAADLAVAEDERYASRGGDKLEHALKTFDIDVSGLVAADIGASSGGFTDCLLQHGAERVYAIDVGRGQLDWRLRQDPRVTVMEGVNIRHLESLPEPVDIVTADVSFISLRLVLPVVARLLRRGEACLAQGDPRVAPASAAGTIIALFKPQFEARKEEVSRGGVVREPLLHATLIGRFAAWCVNSGFGILGLTSSPLLGPAGNREFFFWLRRAQPVILSGNHALSRRSPASSRRNLGVGRRGSKARARSSLRDSAE